MERKLRIAIVGSRAYQDRRKIREFIHKLKEKYGNDLCIVSGGQPEGADGFAKKAALELDVEYKEFPPAHYTWNSYCVNPAFNYGKKYYVYNFFTRNTEIVNYSDVIVCFVPNFLKIHQSKGTYDTYQKATKCGKKTLIIH